MATPIISRGSVRSAIGVEVDALDVTFAGGPDVTVQGRQLSSFARRGGFDGARIEVRRHYAPAWGQPAAGSLHVFEGRASEVTIEGMSVAVRVACDLELLDVAIPRWVLQAPCRHRVYSVGCGASKAAFIVTGAAGAGSTAASVTSALAQADAYFALGVLTFTSGALAGQARMVRAFAGGVFTPVVPFSAAPAPGDAFTALPGCDRARATCGAKFNNLDNFGGQTHIPAPELSY